MKSPDPEYNVPDPEKVFKGQTLFPHIIIDLIIIEWKFLLLQNLLAQDQRQEYVMSVVVSMA